MKNLFGGGKFSREMFLRFINEKSEVADDLFAPAQEKKDDIAWIEEINACADVDLGLEAQFKSPRTTVVGGRLG